MVVYDATIGNALHTLNIVAVGYYVVWILVTPYIDPSHVVHRMFPPKEYGLLIPAVLVTIFASVSLTLASLFVMREGDENPELSGHGIDLNNTPSSSGAGGSGPFEGHAGGSGSSDFFNEMLPASWSQSAAQPQPPAATLAAGTILSGASTNLAGGSQLSASSPPAGVTVHSRTTSMSGAAGSSQ
jgi:dolichyl-phosphate mannosyltransferase polypeptide 2 regulatory subunit